MTQLFSLTDTAVLKIKNMLADQKDKMGLRIGLNTRGCAGLSYTMDYATSDNINECEKLENYEVIFEYCDIQLEHKWILLKKNLAKGLFLIMLIKLVNVVVVKALTFRQFSVF